MNREKNAETEINEERQNCEPDSFSRCVGAVSPSSSSPWDDSIRTGGNDSDQSNTTTVNLRETIPGGIARQLIEQARKQLAYHQEQAFQLEDRIKELEQFTENLSEKEPE